MLLSLGRKLGELKVDKKEVVINLQLGLLE